MCAPRLDPTEVPGGATAVFTFKRGDQDQPPQQQQRQRQGRYQKPPQRVPLDLFHVFPGLTLTNLLGGGRPLAFRAVHSEAVVFCAKRYVLYKYIVQWYIHLFYTPQ